MKDFLKYNRNTNAFQEVSMMYVRYLAASLLFLVSNSCFAMVYDNRYMPLMARPWIAPDDGRSHLSTNLFAVTASSAYDEMGNKVPLPALFGPFDLGKFATTMAKIGLGNPLKTEWQGEDIPWLMFGKFNGQGIDIEWQKFLFWHVWIGGSFMAMRLNSWYDFELKQDGWASGLRNSDKLELEAVRREVLQKAGFCGDHAHECGIGDIDLYLRLGNYWEYALKFRSIQAGGRIGLLIPTAKPRNIHYPASVPFGGDRHWGAYAAVDALFELREDLKVGIYLRASQRFSRVACQRVPVSCEPDNLGVFQGPVDVEPGATLVAAPFISLECLRDGLGLRGSYTLTKHWRDTWNLWPSTQNPGLDGLCNRTSWGSDYFAVNIFYDFGKARPDCTIYPILTFCWDIPASVLVAQSVADTNRVSLGVEVAF
jgi:hypothetical protein